MAAFELTAEELSQIELDYFARWDKDNLSDIIYSNHSGSQPLRSMRGFIMAMWHVEQNWEEDPMFTPPGRRQPLDLERTPLREFLGRRVTIAGGEISIGEAAFDAVCLPSVRRSLQEVLTWGRGSGDQRTREALDFGALAVQIAPDLWRKTLARYAERRLLSWFIVERNSSGWFRYFDRSFSSNEASFGSSKTKPAQRRKVIKTEAGDVELRVNRLHPHNEVANAYEWEARLLSGLGVLQAVANGSVFVRKRGDVWLDLDALFHVADECSDHDAAMVHELDKEGGPMEGLEPVGDMLFVWNWERAPLAAPGSGAACLRAAIASLKKSYRGLNELVFDARPGQFASWSDGFEVPQLGREHPQVAEARAREVSRLAQYIEEFVDLLPTYYPLTLVYPNLDEHPLGVETEIGRRGLQAMAGERPWRGIGNPVADL